jgi:hypothetical protein
LGDGDDDQGDTQPEPVASSTSDATSGTRVACSRSVPSSKATIEPREKFLYGLKATIEPREKFLYGLKAGPEDGHLGELAYWRANAARASVARSTNASPLTSMKTRLMVPPTNGQGASPA